MARDQLYKPHVTYKKRHVGGERVGSIGKIWPTREVEGGGDGSKVTLLAVTSCYKHDP